jgi:hypothetical protein
MDTKLDQMVEDDLELKAHIRKEVVVPYCKVHIC